jgi:hypothetical protein
LFDFYIKFKGEPPFDVLDGNTHPNQMTDTFFPSNPCITPHPALLLHDAQIGDTNKSCAIKRCSPWIILSISRQNLLHRTTTLPLTPSSPPTTPPHVRKILDPRPLPRQTHHPPQPIRRPLRLSHRLRLPLPIIPLPHPPTRQSYPLDLLRNLLAMVRTCPP